MIYRRNEYGYDALKPIEPSVNQFNGDDDRQCSHFGCGRILTLQEALAGNKCINHTGEKKINPNLIIKFK